MNLEQYEKESKRIRNTLIRTILFIWLYWGFMVFPFIYFLEVLEHDWTVSISFIISIAVGDIIILKLNGYLS